MAGFMLLSIVLTTLLSMVQGIPTISITGSKFFTSEGKQFFIKGIAYQLVEDDPLINTAQCQRDAALMSELGTNSIRVYHVDASGDHTGCMNAFAQHGIYIWVDLDSFKTYIRLGTEGPSWTQNKSDSYRAIMDNFQQFDNTGGFFVGNEVLNDIADASSAPYLLSATADLRAYGKAKGYRAIPIGYSATDTGALPMLADYLACRENVEERLDFYGLNSYRWCGASSFHVSGYDVLLNETANYNLPIFFTEVGCNTVSPRVFTDQSAVFNEMADVWSGAIIYEWIQETNNYGLITYGAQQDASMNDGNNVVQGFTRSGTPTPIQPEFNNLKQQWATLKPTGVDSKSYAATVTTSPPVCPTSGAGAGAWTIDPRAALPSLGASALSGMISGFPSSIPHGSITVVSSASPNSGSDSENTTGVPSNPSRSAPNLPLTGSSSGSGSTAASATRSGTASVTSAAAGSRTVSTPTYFDARLIKATLALAGLCFGAMIFL